MFIYRVDKAVAAIEAKSKEKGFGMLHIRVYVEGGKTYISALRPKAISDFYAQADIKAIAEEVDRIVLSIVDDTR